MTANASTAPAIAIFIDADACPVKEETYRVALRHKIVVYVVSNAPFRIPDHPLIFRKVVSDAFDAADDWIAEQIETQTTGRFIVITGDILLAERCIKAGARVLAHNGKPFDAASIGNAIATRAIMADLRAGMDGIGGGPAPFAKADRSRFLQALDREVTAMLRAAWNR